MFCELFKEMYEKSSETILFMLSNNFLGLISYSAIT